MACSIAASSSSAFAAKKKTVCSTMKVHSQRYGSFSQHSKSLSSVRAIDPSGWQPKCKLLRAPSEVVGVASTWGESIVSYDPIDEL